MYNGIIVNISGNNFEKLTKLFNSPFDEEFKEVMLCTVHASVKKLEGVKLAYTYGDNISYIFDKQYMMCDIDVLTTLICSVVTANFNLYYKRMTKKKVTDMFGYFQGSHITVDKDYISEYYGEKQLEYYYEKDIDWKGIDNCYKYGSCIYKDKDDDIVIDTETPSFIDDEHYILDLIKD